MRRPSWLWIPVVASLALAGTAAYLLADSDEEPDCGALAKRERIWDAPGAPNAANRGDTARPIVECRRLIGLSRADVRKLLGPPDEGGGPPNEPGGHEWSYNSGESDYLGDGYYLTVLFGPDGHVESAEITK